ncbi:MAG: hypothetical protein CO105_09555 [Comamonadaceae bacterium CG_4_9_14_3_um_filter_60_33]|nr:MAG: hypothetical protein CO105_09555 [Comamonadaceae bacterium CG_4_9_14_3_um_filter_60_33]
MLDVFVRFEAHEQKIATAASRIEHAKVFQLVEPAVKQGLRSLERSIARRGLWRWYFMRNQLPFLRQRTTQ